MFLFLLPVGELESAGIFSTSSPGFQYSAHFTALAIICPLNSQRLGHTPLYMEFPFLQSSKHSLLLRVYIKSHLLPNTKPTFCPSLELSSPTQPVWYLPSLSFCRNCGVHHSSESLWISCWHDSCEGHPLCSTSAPGWEGPTRTCNSRYFPRAAEWRMDCHV